MDNETENSLQLFEPAPEAVFTIDTAAHLSEMPRHEIGVCFMRGMVAPSLNPECEVYYFDRNAIRELRRIHYVRTVYHTDLRGTEMILDLMNEVDRLREELRSMSR